MMLVVGMGAVGTLLAAHLCGAGRELRLYTRPKDAARFAALTHLQVDFADPRTPPLRAPRPPLAESLDLTGVRHLLICVKVPDLEALLDQLPDTLPAHCTVLCTLNGVAPLRRLRERFASSPVMPLSIMMNGQWIAPLHVRLTTRAEVVIGSHDPALRALFQNTGLAVKTAEGDTGVWGKLLINLANAICALTRTDFRALFTDPHLRRIYAAVLDEATAVLDAAGIAWKLPLVLPYPLYRWALVHGGPLPWWFAYLRNGVRAGAFPSMVADVQAGRVTEVDPLNGEIVRTGAACGVPTPVNAALVDLICTAPAPRSPAALRRALGL